MRRVFLSSTARDLQMYRDAVFKAIQACDDVRVVRMEDFGARAEMTDEFCRAKVAECDLFVGIVGHYFGSSPKGSKKSYTQQEYDAAVETNRPRLMFVAPDDFPLPANLVEDDKKRKLQKEFRSRVMADQPCAFFSAPQDLATKVVTAIRNYEMAPDFSAAEKLYLQEIVAKTELLEFVGIPDPRQNAAIKLEDIFIPLGVEEEIEERDFRIYPEIDKPQEFILKQIERVPRTKTTRRVTLDDALRANTRLMVLGDPGAGKSTLLRYLALVAALSLRAERSNPQNDVEIASSHKSLLAMTKTESRLPILIPLRRFAASNQSLVEFFYTYAKQTYQLDLPPRFFERALGDGRCLVLFDGLDEVVASDQRVEVRDKVAALATRYPNNRFVVTSRIVGYESAPLDRRAFAHHKLLPFEKSEIETFVRKWYAARERDVNQAKSQAEQLIQTIEGNERLEKLAENPLMLTIIALVHRIEAELPNERVKLYDKCTEALLSTWEGVKGVLPPERERERPYYKHRRRLLERLAFWMHTLEQAEGRQAEVKRGDLELQLTKILCEDDKLGLSHDAARAEAQAFIELAKSRTGILVERGDGVFSFVHLTFQEYFAACDLEKRWVTNLERLWQEIQPRLYDPRWREVILLLLGRLNEYDEPPSFIVEKILRERDKFDEVIHRNLFLAAACLADRVNVREPLRNEIVDALLKFATAKRSKYVPLRYDSIRALGNLRGNARAGDGLLALTQNEKIDANARCAAAQVLGELGRADDAVRVLLALAQSAKIDANMRRAAAQVLGELRHADDAVMQGLLALAQDEKVDGYVRRAAAQALGRLGRANDAARLLLALAQGARIDANVRRAAAQALGQLRRADDAVMQGLLALAQDDKIRWDVRYTAVQALGELRHADDAVMQGLLALAQDEKVDGYVQRAAAQALGELGRADDAVIQGLLVLAQDEKIRWGVRYAAAQALGRLGCVDDAVQLLLALVQDEKVDADVQRAAAQALGQLGRADDAVRILLALAQDEKVEAWVRSAAAQALGELGCTDDAVIDGLLALAQDEKVDASVRRAAAQTLGRLGRADDAVRLLLALVQDKKVRGYVRHDAARALGQLGKKSPRVAVVLLELASDKDSWVRNAAYDALKEVVGNLRWAQVSRQETVSSRRKAVRKKIPKPQSKIPNRKS